MANAIRALSMDAVQKANSGHPGMPMGMADVATVLFSRFLKFDPKKPTWADRDRFILSAGHGSMLLYSLLYLTGYEHMPLSELKNFRQLGARTAGHPEAEHEAGVETTTGPLGQGIATAVGFALAERMAAARYGDDIVNHYTYVIASDGDLMEGISHEAASLAGHLGLGKLIVLYDDNGISIDGSTALSFTDHTLDRFRAYGWDAHSVDGHNAGDVAAAIDAAKKTLTPTLIACRTTIGFGAPTKAGSASSHGSPLGDKEIQGAREALGWPYAPFEIPDHIMGAWRNAGARSATDSAAWEKRLAALPADKRTAFERAEKGDFSAEASAAINALKQSASTDKPKLATRACSQKALEVLAAAVPTLVGGSADLTGSNLTLVKPQQDVSRNDFHGSYIRWGVREHGMAAAMNGMALHGGFIPYGGTFLSFADYCRPSIRLSALMKQRVIYVMTHDSIGLGEDGPTHQPIEHLAALRAMPNLNVFRPCDLVETAEAWELAVNTPDTPSLLALSRQGVPTVRTEHTQENLTARGAYVLRKATGEQKVTIFSTGTEIELAMAARDVLEAEGVGTAVVSCPCWELFDKQDAAYQASVLGAGTVRIAIEAAHPMGWSRFVGEDGTIIAISSFGVSAPAEEAYKHFGITSDAIVAAARKRLQD
jgi:transketolase